VSIRSSIEGWHSPSHRSCKGKAAAQAVVAKVFHIIVALMHDMIVADDLV